MLTALRHSLALVVGSTTSLLAQTPTLSVQSTGTTALLQAISVSAADPDVVWMSGHRGTFAVTTDGGRTWRSQVVTGRDSLQFRDLHAVDARRAWLMAAGSGDKSGVFQTADGGVTWTAQFVNRDTAAFFDCMAFESDRRAFAFSDAVAGRMPLIRTANGRDWVLGSIPALDGEGGFAASGSCAQAMSGGRAWIGTGSAATARVLRSTDGAKSWQAAVVPIVSGSGAGVTALSFRDSLHGVAVGGAISGSATGPRVASTADGGATWQVIPDPPIQGALYGAALRQVGNHTILVVVGPGGAAWTADDGAHWAMLDTAPYWSVETAANGVTWLAGPRGRAVRVDWR